jgi:hypothetical protein
MFLFVVQYIREDIKQIAVIEWVSQSGLSTGVLPAGCVLKIHKSVVKSSERFHTDFSTTWAYELENQN